ncbi:MAG: hypothetical protein IT169_12410 [Bryobacterales bacterium]|nr:hypothetical protein [Bryobacterales bacterium]
MPAETISELVQTLNAAEQDAVRAFVRFLRKQDDRDSLAQPKSILLAADEFMREHPEILRRLGQ